MADRSNPSTPERRLQALVDADRSQLQQDGYVVIRDLLSSQEIEAVHRQLCPYLQQKLMGRNEFEGLRSERVYPLSNS